MKKLLLRLFMEQIWVAHKGCKTECRIDNPECIHGCMQGHPKTKFLWYRLCLIWIGLIIPTLILDLIWGKYFWALNGFVLILINLAIVYYYDRGE